MRLSAGGSSDRIARADIAAHLHVAAGLAQDMRDQRRGGRLAVGAGDADERRVRRDAGPLAAEQLDVADDLDAGARAPLDRPMRLGMGQRHAGREHEAPKIATSRRRAGRRSRCPSRRASRASSPDCRPRRSRRAPPASSARAVASPEPPRPKSATVLPAKVRDGHHAPHRSFRVERPTSASTTAMIQKRITTCRLGPADLLEMVVDRRHPEDALAGAA